MAVRLPVTPSPFQKFGESACPGSNIMCAILQFKVFYRFLFKPLFLQNRNQIQRIIYGVDYSIAVSVIFVYLS